MANGTDDLTRLRATYPGWFFTSIWAAASSSADRRTLVAQRGGVVLSDFSATGLAGKIRREEERRGNGAALTRDEADDSTEKGTGHE